MEGNQTHHLMKSLVFDSKTSETICSSGLHSDIEIRENHRMPFVVKISLKYLKKEISLPRGQEKLS